MIYSRTKIEDTVLHPEGKVKLPSGLTVTKLPLLDKTNELYARLTYDDHKVVAAKLGGRQLKREEVYEIAKVGHIIAPVTLSFGPEMLSLEHAETHDARVAAELLDTHWDRKKPVMNVGKWWIDGASKGNVRICGWWDGHQMIQSGIDLNNPHHLGAGSSHFDYGTLSMVAWDEDQDDTHELPGQDDFVTPPTKTIITRVLKRGTIGDDVKWWQSQCSAQPDGKFGPKTEANTKVVQQAHGLKADGIVGKNTVEALDGLWRPLTSAEAPKIVPVTFDGLPISFKQAHDYQKGRPLGPPIWIVMHTAECGKVHTAAENLQSWATGDINASWHYAVDNDSIAQSVHLDDRAWAVGSGPAHDRGIHIELAGFASQSTPEWHDQFSCDTLSLTAKLVAKLCKKFSIPPEFRSATDLLAGTPGITAHVEVSHAWKHSNHTDPGTNFPWNEFLSRVKEQLQ